jgi:hypothetical protein
MTEYKRGETRVIRPLRSNLVGWKQIETHSIFSKQCQEAAGSFIKSTAGSTPGYASEVNFHSIPLHSTLYYPLFSFFVIVGEPRVLYACQGSHMRVQLFLTCLVKKVTFGLFVLHMPTLLTGVGMKAKN